jgi:phospholipid-binding lipoprotein MlaA
VLTATVLLGGCASIPAGEQRDPRDPWERTNRAIWTFDYAFDRGIFRPVARAYVNVTPAPVRRGISNFFDNLLYTDVIINDFLQGKAHDGGSDIVRLLVNTVFGLGGFLDPATHMNLDKHSADVGQSFGIWGVPTGPFFMLPFYGPSDIRDAFGLVGDEYATPRPYLNNQYLHWSLWLVDKVDIRSQLLSQDQFIDTAYDPYTFVRNAYLQHRDFLVHGSQSQSLEQEFPELQQSGPGGGGTTPPGAPPPPPPR